MNFIVCKHRTLKAEELGVRCTDCGHFDAYEDREEVEITDPALKELLRLAKEAHCADSGSYENNTKRP